VKHAPLHRKLFLWFGMSILITAAIAGGVFGAIAKFTETDWKRDLARLQTFASNMFAEVWSEPGERERLAQRIAGDLEVRVSLYDARDQLLLEAGPTCDRARWKVPVTKGAERLGTITFCAPRHWSGAPLKFLLPVAVLALLLWGMSHKLARKLAYPLREVARVAREIGDGNLDARPRIHPQAAGEVRTLATSIDDMASRIKKQLDDQRVLLAAVSHELRTPLGHLRILAELARDEHADRRKIVDEIENEVKEIDELVGQLLANARLDFSAVEKKAFDAADAARRALERKGIGADKLVVEGDVQGAGDPTLIARALANLIDNAIKHGEGLTVLRVAQDGTQVRFEVEDRGPGIPDGTKIFELFTAGTREHGNLGLGLALVRRIAEAHGGRAFASNLPGGGARIGFLI
jgi:signal transduction histidine kinase